MKYLYEVLSNQCENIDGVWEVNDSSRVATVYVDPDWDDERILKTVAAKLAETSDEDELEALISGWEIDEDATDDYMIFRAPDGMPSYTLNRMR